MVSFTEYLADLNEQTIIEICTKKASHVQLLNLFCYIISKTKTFNEIDYHTKSGFEFKKMIIHTIGHIGCHLDLVKTSAFSNNLEYRSISSSFINLLIDFLNEELNNKQLFKQAKRKYYDSCSFIEECLDSLQVD
jgi:hypothetical protein